MNPTHQAQLQAIVNGYRGTMYVNYLGVASHAVVYADFLHTFPDEVRLMWPAPLSIPKFLFFFLRYYTLAHQALPMLYGLPRNVSPNECKGRIILTGISCLVITVASEAILFIRVYGFSGKSRKVLVFLAFLFLSMHAPALVLDTMFTSTLRYVKFPIPNLVCMPVEAHDLWHAAVFATMLGSLLVVMFMMIFIAFKKHRHSNSPLLTIFYRDGIFYFICLSVFAIGNIIANLAAPNGGVKFVLPFSCFLHTFPDEVRLMWPTPLSVPKVLFFCLRYYTLAHQVLAMWYGLPRNVPPHECKDRLVLADISSLLVIIASEAILFFRVYAFSGKSRKVLVYLITQFLVRAISHLDDNIPEPLLEVFHVPAFVLDIKFTHTVKYVKFPIPNLVCMPAEAQEVLQAGVFALFLASVLAVMFMMIYVAFIKHRNFHSPLLTLFYRDGVTYFVCHSVLATGNIIASLAAPAGGGLKFILVQLEVNLHAILATRMLLHLREHAERDRIHGWCDATGTMAEAMEYSAAAYHPDVRSVVALSTMRFAGREIAGPKKSFVTSKLGAFSSTHGVNRQSGPGTLRCVRYSWQFRLPAQAASGFASALAQAPMFSESAAGEYKLLFTQVQLHLHLAAMPKIRTSRTKQPPEGYEDIEAILDDYAKKMRDAENESHEGKRKAESLWPIMRISHARSRYVYELYYKRDAISRELYDWLLKEGYADANLIAKWKKPGYEKLCCLRCIQTRDMNYQGSTCICRVPKAQVRAGTIVECVHCVIQDAVAAALIHDEQMPDSQCSPISSLFPGLAQPQRGFHSASLR
ncbi:hypothetical protein NMY22_g2627 [Coprinellus aureogranulatus]|nr:hypothetical protein NMY22_g2627 [Coprinellus aureogranulatus]